MSLGHFNHQVIPHNAGFSGSRKEIWVKLLGTRCQKHPKKPVDDNPKFFLHSEAEVDVDAFCTALVQSFGEAS
jgi:hypothetical protein